MAQHMSFEAVLVFTSDWEIDPPEKAVIPNPLPWSSRTDAGVYADIGIGESYRKVSLYAPGIIN